MNLLSYIDKYGCYTMDEVPFNEIDNVVLSMLSYLDLNGIVSSNKFNPKSIKQIGNIILENYDKKKTQILILKRAVSILKNIKDTRRYSNLFVYNYIYRSSGNNQFCAVTIEINRKLVFVSFEGTDHLVSGWKEDFMMCYKFPVEAQRMAIDYVNRNFLFRRKKIILGGHSKGGNLAIAAGMYANFLVKDKIISIYNNDGPGLLSKQFKSKEYKSIENKLIHIVPNYSVFGLLLNHSDKIEVVKSFRKSIYSHDPMTWVVDDKQFMRTELSSFSNKLDNRLLEFIRKYDETQRESHVLELFEVFERASIVSFMDILDNKKLIFNIITESKDMNKETKSFLKEVLSIIFECLKTVSKEEIMNIFDKKINRE